MVHVLLSDGRIYCFLTEMWPEHGNGDSNWPRVMELARDNALWLAERGATPYATVPSEFMPDVIARECDLHAYVDLACELMSDEQFWAGVWR